MQVAPSFEEMQSILHHTKTRSNIYDETQRITSLLYNEVNLKHSQQKLVLSCSFRHVMQCCSLLCYEMNVLGMYCCYCKLNSIKLDSGYFAI